MTLDMQIVKQTTKLDKNIADKKTASGAIHPLDENQDPLKIVIVGHVDHGKSTLIGRLLFETGSLPESKIKELEKVSSDRSMEMEWSFLLDAFQSERDQAVTIDTTQVFFKSAKRHYVIIDAPGHREFLKNMISGAAAAEAGVLVIDAFEGIGEQTRRHAQLLSLLGMKQVVVVINKMDMVDNKGEAFDLLSTQVRAYLKSIDITPQSITPLSARYGDNIIKPSAAYDWYEGGTFLDAMDSLESEAPREDLPLRFPIQDVYHFDKRRILVGRIASGALSVGDEVVFSPSNKTARIKSIMISESEPLDRVSAGYSIGVLLDQPLFLERGEVMSHLEQAPKMGHRFKARLFWLGHEPLRVGNRYKIKIGTAHSDVEVDKIDHVLDLETLSHEKSEEIPRNGIGEVLLKSRRLLSLDEARELPASGRFVLLDRYDTVAGGLVILDEEVKGINTRDVVSRHVFSVDHGVDHQVRAQKNGHQGGVLWLTGLSGAGKTTLAMELEKALFRKGRQVYVLDGDNIRRGVNANLGFSPDDREENIRRVGEIAGLFAEAGIICITAFISPYRVHRNNARDAADRVHPNAFHEIFVDADLDVCESRDPKGLYKLAREGKIDAFTGISAPYEKPNNPDLVVNTSKESVDTSLERLIHYVDEVFALPDDR